MIGTIAPKDRLKENVSLSQPMHHSRAHGKPPNVNVTDDNKVHFGLAMDKSEIEPKQDNEDAQIFREDKESLTGRLNKQYMYHIKNLYWDT